MPAGSLGAGEAQGNHWQDSTGMQLTLLTLEPDRSSLVQTGAAGLTLLGDPTPSRHQHTGQVSKQGLI